MDAFEGAEFSTHDASCESSSNSRANRVDKTMVVSLPCTHQLIGRNLVFSENTSFKGFPRSLIKMINTVSLDLH